MQRARRRGGKAPKGVVVEANVSPSHIQNKVRFLDTVLWYIVRCRAGRRLAGRFKIFGTEPEARFWPCTYTFRVGISLSHTQHRRTHPLSLPPLSLSLSLSLSHTHTLTSTHSRSLSHLAHPASVVGRDRPPRDSARKLPSPLALVLSLSLSHTHSSALSFTLPARPATFVMVADAKVFVPAFAF